MVYNKLHYMNNVLMSLIISLTAFTSCVQQENSNKLMSNNVNNTISDEANNAIPAGTQTDTATFGTGCFWCTEAIFQQLEGVLKATSGYSGGFVENPTYKQVCEGNTGHAEVIQIVYDPKKISFDELLKAFWESHDPTTLNRQGNDVGPQYRSVIFYHNQEQKDKAENIKPSLTKIKLSAVQS